MAEPALELSYRWRFPLIAATVLYLLCVVMLARGPIGRWAGIVAVATLVWLCYVALVLSRCRAYLQVDGRRLTVRNVGRLVEIEAAEVIRVRHLVSARGPSFRLRLRRSDREIWQTVPTALLAGGQSTLFGWLLEYAPEAQLDKGSTRVLELLRIKGLLQ